MEKEQAIIQKWNTLVKRTMGDAQDNEPMINDSPRWRQIIDPIDQAMRAAALYLTGVLISRFFCGEKLFVYSWTSIKIWCGQHAQSPAMDPASLHKWTTCTWAFFSSPNVQRIHSARRSTLQGRVWRVASELWSVTYDVQTAALSSKWHFCKKKNFKMTW